MSRGGNVLDSPHFAGQNSQTRLKPEPSSDTLWRKINANKEISIKQAKAAHHEKILISYIEQDKPPSGILRPILNTVTNTIMAPSKCDTDFLTNMRYATEKFCLEITNILNKQWSKQKEQLRTEAKSAKEIVYADAKYLHGNDMKLFQATIKKAEETICREKKKLAQSREWKLNKLKKRPSESHPAEPSYKHVKMTYAAAETTAITRHPTEQLCTSPIWFKRTLSNNMKSETVKITDQKEYRPGDCEAINRKHDPMAGISKTNIFKGSPAKQGTQDKTGETDTFATETDFETLFCHFSQIPNTRDRGETNTETNPRIEQSGPFEQNNKAHSTPQKTYRLDQQNLGLSPIDT